MSDAVLDMTAIAEAKETMEDKFPKMVGYFLEDIMMYVEKVEEGFAAAKAEAVVPPAHSLKSSSRQMGAKRLSEVAEEIERIAREAVKGNNTLDRIRGRLVDLKQALAETQQAYRTLS